MNKIPVERLVNKYIGQIHAKIFRSKIFSVDLTINLIESLRVIWSRVVSVAYCQQRIITN
jgi:hypothetical protein